MGMRDEEAERETRGGDTETVELVEALLATGFTPAVLCAVLTIDGDTLRRWRRGVPASHLSRKMMRLTLFARSVAPGVLTVISELPVAKLATWAESCPARWLSSADVARERASRAERLALWRDGADDGV